MALDLAVVVNLPDGTPYGGKYELNFGDCTGLDDLDCRRVTGFSLSGLLGEVTRDGGLSLTFAVTIAWIAMRKQFPHRTWENVAESVSWGSDFTVEYVTPSDDEEKEQGSEKETRASSEPSPRRTASGRGKSTS